ncbi:MAG: VCBS repeat-containing protein [Acidimicrobiia bacterium]|nr:VCBS repeat-containing protein [Acidimicrobiia bacterium]
MIKAGIEPVDNGLNLYETPITASLMFLATWRRTPSTRPRGDALVIAVTLLVALVPVPARAATTVLTPMTKMQDIPYWRFFDRGTSESFSAVAVGDVQGDAAPEFVVGGMDGFVRIYDVNGAKVRSCDSGAGHIQSSPTLFDFDQNGKLDILVGNALTSWVVVFRGTDCAQHFAQLAWGLYGDMERRGVFGTPTVADLDRDGQMEIVATSWDHFIHAWNLDGSYVPGFPRFLFDTLWSSPTVADLDGDGWLEIVFGGDMDEYAGQPYATGGLIWVIRHDGSVQPGFPKEIPGRQTIWSTPAVVDINGDGSLDIVFGTGTMFADRPENGHRIHALDRFGSYLPGWPAFVGDNVMASPAVGDLHPTPGKEVVTMSEDGVVHVHSATGVELWSRCNTTGYTPCRRDFGVHGSLSIADVDNDGQQEVVGAGEHVLRVMDGATGAVEAESSMGAIWAPPAAPTIAQVNGETWILQAGIFDANSDGRRGLGDVPTVWRWRSGQPLGRADWPTFKQNSRRTGTVLDESPPTAALGALAPSQSHTSFDVAWSGTDQGTGIVSFTVDVRDNGGQWATWLTRAPQTASGGSFGGWAKFFGIAGHQYDFRVQATDAAGNKSAAGTAATTVAAGATRDQPFASAYAVTWDGITSAVSSPPGTHPQWPNWNIARGVAAHPGGGGYVLDGYGGIHAIGNAPAVQNGGYWKGWDITRGIALNPDGAGGYVLDGYGGLHRFGQTDSVAPGGYWRGWDIAHEIELSPVSTAADPKGLVMDRWGGLHAFGNQPQPGTSAYWPGWEIARGIALDPDDPTGRSGVVLDGWGGLHPFGGAAKPTGGPYWKNWDIARDVVVIADGNPSVVSGYILDGWGGTHRFGSAPPVYPNVYMPLVDKFRFFDVAP